MEYKEKADFDEKLKVLKTMFSRFENYEIEQDISKNIALEIGGAGGVLGGLLSNSVSHVTVTDIVNTQSQYNGEFPKLLKEKFQRNGHDFQFDKIDFHTSNAMDFPYKNDLFDMVVSLNAFEHIPDPLIALNEALRVTKRGGIIYLTFDPVWTADTGNHFSHLVNEPWAHLLDDDDSFCNKMRAAGAADYLLSEYRNGMNRKPASLYQSQFTAILESYGVARFYMEKWEGCADSNHLNHPNRFLAAKKLGYEANDLLIRGFAFIILK